MNRGTPVKLHIVSEVQDAVNRANAEAAHIKESEHTSHVSSHPTVRASTTSEKKKQKKKKLSTVTTSKYRRCVFVQCASPLCVCTIRIVPVC